MLLARKLGKRGLIVPAESADEAALFSDVEICPVQSLDQTVQFLDGTHEIPPVRSGESRFFQSLPESQRIDFSEAVELKKF